MFVDIIGIQDLDVRRYYWDKGLQFVVIIELGAFNARSYYWDICLE